MMTKSQFTALLKNHNFKELFITEMGWNNPKSKSDILLKIDETDYTLQPVAERSGFGVYACEVTEMPSATMIRKIDSKLRRAANDYICIYYQSAGDAQAWAAPVNTTEKREVIIIEYETTENKLQFLFEKVHHLSFALTEQTTISDVRERVAGEFKVNGEKLTKEFYSGFRKVHMAFAEFIIGIDDHIEVKDNKSKQWYASVMLNRLMFCYFIQKKGFLNKDEHYLRNKLHDVQQNEGRDKFFGSFYRSFLLHLFQDGLNAPLHDSAFVTRFGKIPYLNGGMFDLHQIEKDYSGIDIPDEAFERLFNFFDKWRWHLDYRVTASGRDINPDVLGYIFEQYINDRAQKGAYYTKEDITEYIGKNCILPFLMDKLKEQSPDAFKPNGYVWTKLRESGDKYIYDAVKKGIDHFDEIPEEIAQGLDTTKPNLLERRAHWNDRTPDTWALPTEIWRETIERLLRCQDIQRKIANGEITEINDFITYNLDIRQFVQDLLEDTKDHLFLLHFMKALLKVSILDPTCGSGAFLFAAMNILEPLYEACVNGMRKFNEQDPNLFKENLAELDTKYRSNVQYFIYKTIILNNLYGVDIMHEATEIAKLRLFLKMVAVVDVDMRADNLGLDPLPDIDFNIRCGNSLVGYATEEQLNTDLSYGDMFANLEFKDKIETEMQKVSKTFERFRKLQLTQSPDDMQAFKEAKKELNERLAALNDLLNHKMYQEITVGSQSYESWLASHQPFHWLAEYYNIIHGNGGFDVIIGNPPYVEYNQSNVEYKINFTTNKYSNLYAYCLDRCVQLGSEYCCQGLIVPMSISSIREYSTIRNVLSRGFKNLYITNHAIRPQSLFVGVSQRVSIVLLNNSSKQDFIYTTKYLRTKNQNYLFKVLKFQKGVLDSNRDDIIPKIGCDCFASIFEKTNSKRKDLLTYKSKYSTAKLFYKDYGETYWIFPFNFDPCLTPVESFKNTPFSKEMIDNIFAILNSSFFYLYYTAISDCWHLGMWHFAELPISCDELPKLSGLAKNLAESMKSNRIVRFDKRAGGNIYEYKIYKSKSIIDEIDKVLAAHYGFTEEELDFIINYDIKYRMGDELNDE